MAARSGLTRAAWTRRQAHWMARYDALPVPRPVAVGVRLLRRVSYWQGAADQATAALAALPAAKPRPDRFGWSGSAGLSWRRADGTPVR